MSESKPQFRLMADGPKTLGSLAVKPVRLLQRLLAGSLANVRFEDLLRLVEALGFELSRIAGSHRIYRRADVAELLSLQPHRGHAKPYQIRQLLVLVRVYNLSLRDEP